MVEFEGLTHIHLLVRDLERSLKFYNAVFGLEEKFRDGPTMIFLAPKGTRDTITLNLANEKQLPLVGQCAGIEHFGFRLKNRTQFDEAIKLIEANGGKLLERGQHPNGQTFAYVADPDGYKIEL